MNTSFYRKRHTDAIYHRCGILGAALGLILSTLEAAAAPVTPGELVSPKIQMVGGSLAFTVQPSVFGRRYQLQSSPSMLGGTWLNVGWPVYGTGSNLVTTTPHTAGLPRKFFRLELDGAPVVPAGFVLIPAGNFQMGDQSNPTVSIGGELPAHSVYVSPFGMAEREVTKQLWDDVRAWALTHGYTDLEPGSTVGGILKSKGPTHPVHSIIWQDMVKWCNARSEKDNLIPCYTVAGAIYRIGLYEGEVACNWAANGYRLPGEAEWEKAARGGQSALNFPWGNTVMHSNGNYYSQGSQFHSYDLSPTPRFHPTYNVLEEPYTAPAGSFAANGYGLYDMAGNIMERCWDWQKPYTAAAVVDPHGPATPFNGLGRVLRGGHWGYDASSLRCSYRTNTPANSLSTGVGFRVARGNL